MGKRNKVIGCGRRWTVDFTDNSNSPLGNVTNPPGFTLYQEDSSVCHRKKEPEASWNAQKAWEVAQAPLKSVFITCFMMWMAGNTIHLYSIDVLFSALWQHISALRAVRKVFKPYVDSKVDLRVQKLIFISFNLGPLALGIWKLNTLRPLPTRLSDWISSLPPPQEIEYSGGGIPLH